MTSNKTVFLFLLVVLTALSSSNNGVLLVVRADDETGNCVTSADGETCVNPDANAEPAAATETDAEQQQVEEEEPVIQEEEPAHDNEAVEEETEEVQAEAAPEAEKVVEATEEQEVQEEAAPEEEEVVVEATDSQEEDDDEENTPSCPSRKHVIKCAGEYLDTNGNTLLERSELHAAIDKLPWLSRGVLSILGSVDKMMAKCDVDGDGAIGMGYDMAHNGETCLATCFKRRAFKSAFFSDCKA